MKKSAITFITLTFIFTSAVSAFCEELVVYTARKEYLIRPVFKDLELLGQLNGLLNDGNGGRVGDAG